VKGGIDKKSRHLVGTRFSLKKDGSLEMPGDVMEHWMDECLKEDKDVKKLDKLHQFSKDDIRKASMKYGCTKAQLLN